MSCFCQNNLLKVVPVAAGAAIVLYVAYRKIYKGGCCGGGEVPSCCINKKVCKDKDKVCDMVDVSEFGDKTAFCRCWKSDKFPYCDGSHAKHNSETGDNVGPLVITKKAGKSE